MDTSNAANKFVDVGVPTPPVPDDAKIYTILITGYLDTSAAFYNTDKFEFTVTLDTNECVLSRLRVTEADYSYGEEFTDMYFMIRDLEPDTVQEFPSFVSVWDDNYADFGGTSFTGTGPSCGPTLYLIEQSDPDDTDYTTAGNGLSISYLDGTITDPVLVVLD